MNQYLRPVIPFKCDLCSDSGIFLKKAIACSGPCACTGDCKDQYVLCECVLANFKKLKAAMRVVEAARKWRQGSTKIREEIKIGDELHASLDEYEQICREK